MKLRLSLLITALLLPAVALAQSVPEQQNAFAFSGKDAEDALAPAIIGAEGGSDVKVQIAGVREDDTIITASASITADVEGMDLDKDHNRWQATLILKAGGRNLAPVKLSGSYQEMTDIPVLKRRVQAGEIIGMEDIEWSKQPAAHIYKSTITSAEDMVGKTPRHTITENRPVRLEEIASPSIIAKGARVTLLYKTHNIEIKTLGEAQESGAKGDVIRVKNLTSKAIIEGTVEAGGLVWVSAFDAGTSAEVVP